MHLTFPPVPDRLRPRRTPSTSRCMEQTLREGAAALPTHVDVRFGVEVEAVEQDDDGVTIDHRDLATGETTTTRARYALACDGGSQPHAQAAGRRAHGRHRATSRWVVIDARVKRWWPERHILTFWSDKQATGGRHRARAVATTAGSSRSSRRDERDFATARRSCGRCSRTLGVSPRRRRHPPARLLQAPHPHGRPLARGPRVPASATPAT